MSLTRVEELREGKSEGGGEGEGELAEMGKGGGKCQEWIELQEGRLPGSTKRWEVFFLSVPLFGKIFLPSQVTIDPINCCQIDC